MDTSYAKRKWFGKTIHTIRIKPVNHLRKAIFVTNYHMSSLAILLLSHKTNTSALDTVVNLLIGTSLELHVHEKAIHHAFLKKYCYEQRIQYLILFAFNKSQLAY